MVGSLGTRVRNFGVLAVAGRMGWVGDVAEGLLVVVAMVKGGFEGVGKVRRGGLGKEVLNGERFRFR